MELSYGVMEDDSWLKNITTVEFLPWLFYKGGKS